MNSKNNERFYHEIVRYIYFKYNLFVIYWFYNKGVCFVKKIISLT